jgi:hypothetical protein
MCEQHRTKLSQRILYPIKSLFIANLSVMTYKINVIDLKDGSGSVSNSYKILNKG